MSTETAIVSALTAAERDLKAELEATIRAGLATFVEVGQALRQVRDARLYRDDFETFEDYCLGRWQMSRIRGYQLIEAAEVVSTMVNNDLPAPPNERQARELAKVPEERRAEVWEKTLTETDGKPTAAAVKAAAAPPPPVAAPPMPTPAPAPAPRRPEPVADRVHTPVGPISKSVAAALDKHVPHPDPHGDWRAAFVKAVGKVHALMRFTAAEVAERGDDTCFDELVAARNHLDEYLDAVRRARLADIPDNVSPIRRPA